MVGKILTNRQKIVNIFLVTFPSSKICTTLYMITCWTVGTISGHHIASVQGSSLEHHHLLPHNVLVIITHQWSCIDQLYIPSKLTMLGWTNFFIKSISSENLWMSFGSLLVSVFTATRTDPCAPQISCKE